MHDLKKLAASWEDDPCFAKFNVMASEFIGDGTTQNEDVM
jgi:hypothetical protein